MAQQLYFSRDTKVYIEIGSDVWEMPVLDGFSFSQATNVSEITLSEMEDANRNSKRGKRAFNDSLAPAEWSFSTYVRPFISATNVPGTADTAANHHAVEEVLWALMVGDAAYASNTFTGFNEGDVNPVVVDVPTANLNIRFANSNKSILGTANIYFVVGNDNKKVYKLAGSVVNEAVLNFEIDGIATIDWSGLASEVIDDTANGLPTATIYEGTQATDNFIRNRLTQLTIAPTNTDPDGDGGLPELEASYDLTLTGGSITISNNITYIIPEELGKVNIPIGHVTGGRSVSGNFTCYLLKDTTAINKSSDFFQDMKDITNVVTNSFALTFKVGGGSSTPRLELEMPTAHVDIPTHSIEDVIALETNFNALPSSIELTNEVKLKYVGA